MTEIKIMKGKRKRKPKIILNAEIGVIKGFRLIKTIPTITYSLEDLEKMALTTELMKGEAFGL